MRRLSILPLALILFTANACTSEGSLQERLDKANESLQLHAGDAFRRAIALGHYRHVYAKATDAEMKRDAGFGVGMIGFIDLIHAASQLANETTTTTEDDAEGAAALPSAADLLPIVSELVDSLLDDGIVQPWQAVIQADDFSFKFAEDSFVIPAFSEDGTDIDLSGEWDLTEIRIVYGLVQTVIASYRYVKLYDLVLETVVDAALTDATVPDLPENPADFPFWILEVSDALGFAAPPWLDPNFGLMSDKTELVDIRNRLSDGVNRILEGLEYLRDEDDDQTDDVFPKNAFLKQVLVRLAGVDPDDIVVVAIDPLVPLVNIIELVTVARDSLDQDDAVLLPPDWVWELVETGVSVGAPNYSGPVTPVGLRIPAVNLSRLFTHPIEDLKDSSSGLLPYYCDADEVDELPCSREGEFVTQSEQEPYAGEVEDGNFDDTGIDCATRGRCFADANYDGDDDGFDFSIYVGDGEWQEDIALRAGDPALEDAEAAALLPPLAHRTPTGGVELPNGIVDPVYTFFVNSSFNDFLVPIVATGENEYAVDTAGAYGNPDLMRLLSAIIWIVESVDDED